jgi:hypothetical protein
MLRKPSPPVADALGDTIREMPVAAAAAAAEIRFSSSDDDDHP